MVVAGRQIGSWAPGERGVRNALMVKLAEDPSVILEDLARAFEVSSETLRLQRRLYEQEGLEAVLKRGEPHQKGGRPLSPAVQRKLERLFARGKATSEVVAALGGRVHRGTVDKYRRRWDAKCAKRSKVVQQTSLPLEPGGTAAQADGAPEACHTASTGDPSAIASEPAEGSPATRDADEKLGPTEVADEQSKEKPPPIRAPRQETSERVARAAPTGEPAPEEGEGASARITEFAPHSARGVQHLGAWLLLVAIGGLGFYTQMRRHERRRPQGRPLRVAVDAVLCGLAIGGRCVESVRRLATSSIAAMLLADSAPSATWVRRTLGDYCAENVSAQLLEDVSGELLLQARERTPRGKPVVLFVDNHGRPYTGMHQLRRIWRMQEKCTVPGAMDHWVHDSEGRPVLVIPSEPNASLPNTIRARVGFIREKLGKERQLLLAFDRAGAFPGLWKWLRDNGVQFVTYQRARYRKFGREWFARHGRQMTLREASGKRVKVMVQDGRMNLGKQRGRVRRIRILMPDGAQMNVVAWSSQPTKWLCQTLFSRWRQENAFKHGVQRWGINQLDGRKVENVPAGTGVTNPLRKNLDRSLRSAREREKKLRLQLQQLYPGHPDRRQLKRELAANLAGQQEVMTARSAVPEKVPIEQTELHGELKQHTREYKLLMDTMRCVAQNAEAELAGVLGPSMPVPAEAKRLLQNLFGAMGDIRVSRDAITVTLDPAANRPERAALNQFFAVINRRRLCHPGDPFSRPVRFRLQMR